MYTKPTMSQILDLFLHLDTHLTNVIHTYGVWTYVLLFVIIFCETGLVVTPFLPGDSLLFAAAALAARGDLSIGALWLILTAAAILGNTANYWIGYHVGEPILKKLEGKWIKQKHLDETHAFYTKYGSKAVILSRFLPIVRTFVPFVAGIGEMGWKQFMVYNAIGGVAWASVLLGLGYFFGNIPSVQHNFSLVVIVIALLSLVPPVIAVIRKKFKKNSRA